MPRSRYTDIEKRQWVSRFNRDNSSAAAFCREHRLPYGSFRAWRRNYYGKPAGMKLQKRRAAQKTEFIEVSVEPHLPPAKPEPPAIAAELSLGCGITLRVYSSRTS